MEITPLKEALRSRNLMWDKDLKDFWSVSQNISEAQTVSFAPLFYLARLIVRAVIDPLRAIAGIFLIEIQSLSGAIFELVNGRIGKSLVWFIGGQLSVIHIVVYLASSIIGNAVALPISCIPIAGKKIAPYCLAPAWALSSEICADFVSLRARREQSV
ncbi:MAG: hypothetical protein A3F09_00995 [Chlamydiae bacterium RIFCSPHIGHO2_12_FULL_49_11]|nr:MAG: hypothetical protein A3F09_00995 [Chlamydiae bacterium RIFCSPHIGHO2_12_FULL_49_11]